MKTSSIEIVLDILRKQNYDPIIVEDSYLKIKWTDEKGDLYYIDESDIDIYMDNIAWFQYNMDDNDYLLKTHNSSHEFKWEPITHNPFFGCLCILVRWYHDKLLFVYKEKHEIYICSLHNGIVNYIKFLGEEIMVNQDLLTYTKYDDIINLVKIPELNELGTISLEKAKKMNLVPECIQDMDYDILKTK